MRQARLNTVEDAAAWSKVATLASLRAGFHSPLDQVRSLSPDQLAARGTLVCIDDSSGPVTVLVLIENSLIAHLEEHTSQLRAAQRT